MKTRFQISRVKRRDTDKPTEEIRLIPVSDNVAKADISITIDNPADFGKFQQGDQVEIEIKKISEGKKAKEPEA